MKELKCRAWDEINKTMFQVHSLGDNRLDDCLNFYVNGKEFPLMQYTGLKDRNGVEVYEGDILQDPHDGFNRPYLISWGEAGFWGEPVVPDGTRQFGSYIRARETRAMLIIGNIYQNPELLLEVKS